MNTAQYTAKISSQGQITLPRAARELLGVAAGHFIAIKVVGRGRLEVSDELPIERAFGSLGMSLTSGEDAAVYTRKLRRTMEGQRFGSD
jgi:bifunctional DNA-binding transcriptional regulator/antitoxin component of YhaV-PrlF toxin-antitoxin module